MTVAVCLVGDGRLEYLERAVASLDEQVVYPWVARIMVNDSGSRQVERHLAATYPDWQHLTHVRRCGTVKAVRTAWRAALKTGADYVFHTEEDFTYNQPVEIDRMAQLLEQHPDLAQVVLKRDPYGWPEQEAGGYMELHPDRYTERESSAGPWCEHTKLFSSNPSLIPRRVIKLAPFSGEARYGAVCVRHGYRFAYWGAKTDPPRVTHIGEVRSVGWRD